MNAESQGGPIPCPMCGKPNMPDPARPFCAACGARLLPGGAPATLPATSGPAPLRPPEGGGARKGTAILLWVLAAASLAFFLIEPYGVLLFLVAVFGAGGAGLWSSAKKELARAEEEWVGQLQLQVLRLAQSVPRLTVLEVAQRMGWPIPLAERVLVSLDQDGRVHAMPDDDGVMVYEFRALRADRPGPSLPA